MPVAALIRLLLGLLTPVIDRRRIAAAVERGATAAALLLLAGLALLVAVGMASAALWVIASASLGSAGASLALAGGFVALALALLLAAWIVRNPRRNAAAPVATLAANPVDPLLAAAAALFGNNKAVLTVAALVAGLLAERLRKREPRE